MFKMSNAITICVDKEYWEDVRECIKYVKTVGVQQVHARNNNIYVGFNTKLPIGEVAKILKEKLYKVQTIIIGGTIFVEF